MTFASKILLAIDTSFNFKLSQGILYLFEAEGTKHDSHIPAISIEKNNVLIFNRNF